MSCEQRRFETATRQAIDGGGEHRRDVVLHPIAGMLEHGEPGGASEELMTKCRQASDAHWPLAVRFPVRGRGVFLSE